MNFSLTSEQQLLRNTAREFLAIECPISVVREAEESGVGHAPDLWRKMADLGCMGICLPKKYGGEESLLTDQTVLFEEVGRALVPGPLLSSSVLAAQIVLHGGTDQQKETLLPGMISE